MPKKGNAVCQECNAELNGEFPDNNPLHKSYWSISGEIDMNLVDLLKKHHSETATVINSLGNYGGHEWFDVFLEDGNFGSLRVSSYNVIYRELGKERY